ncbi:MAG UNVERIFIED_CONTAM: transcription antitermination protein NusB [Planctomycetaceae bacterium]
MGRPPGTERTDRFLQDTLADLAHCHQLPSAERALAVDIASGVIRRRRTLDCLIAKVLTRPRQQTEPELWQILRMGVFQLFFARTPPHAAVSSSVELCRSLHRDRWTGFVNGILAASADCSSINPLRAPPLPRSQQTADAGFNSAPTSFPTRSCSPQNGLPTPSLCRPNWPDAGCCS